MPVTKARREEVVRYFLANGEEETLALYQMKADSLRRYISTYKKEHDTFESDVTLLKIKEQYSDVELKAIAKGGGLVAGRPHVPIINFNGEVTTLGVFSDMHIGSNYFREQCLDAAYNEFARVGVEYVMNSGDVVEGMSNRAGHVYELTHIGYAQQKEYAIKLLSQWPGPQYFIDGNHDRWYIKAGDSGALIVPDICDHVPNATFLGHDEGNVSLNGTVIKLWHGEDANSYATSYRVQKIIEAFQPGEKPNLLLCGHTHKQFYMFARAVHAISTGAISGQSKWMRSKRMENHTGFWIVKLCIREGNIVWIEPRWYPFYF